MNYLSKTQMHPVTLVFILLELMLFSYQFFHFLSRPQDKQRLWYLLLLFFLLHYNLWNGLFPDASLGIKVKFQYMIADGFGYLMGAYFPFYFYKAFDFRNMRFYATYGSLAFLLVPYLFCEVIAYDWNGSLLLDREFGVLIPFAYGLVVLTLLFRNIRLKYKAGFNKAQYREEMTVWIAILPWQAMAAFAFFPPSQVLKIIMANSGLILITLYLMIKSVKHSRQEYRELKENRDLSVSPEILEANYQLYSLTKREIEIVEMLRQRLTNKVIGELLFISDLTVKTHIRNLFEKVQVNSRVDLIRKLETPID